ncbi:MAG: type III-A CRISPR-associated protein Cas10/Csm1, partial [Cyanobacteria bacterium P01_F01_bin.86]
MAVLTHQVALKIFQEALLILSEWCGADVSHQLIDSGKTGEQAIIEAKKLVNWPSQATPSEAIGALKVVFDSIKLEQRQKAVHYWPAWAIKNTDNPRDSRKHYPQIPYPMTQEPDEAQINALKGEAKDDLAKLTSDDWGQLSLLMLMLEKYGTYISFGEPDIAFFDQVKTTAAIAAALGKNPATEELCLVAGDLSGIQDFIYTISSDGALKSLRARSFTLELVTEEIVQQLLTRLELPRSNVIYAGGGNLYLLAPAGEDIQQKVSKIREGFNDWLLTEFQSKVFLSLTSCAFPKSDVGKKEFTVHWEAAIQKLAVQKSRKFDRQITSLLATRHAHEPCKVCHRDDTTDIKPWREDGVEACPTCREMLRLGQKLFNVGALVRSTVEDI